VPQLGFEPVTCRKQATRFTELLVLIDGYAGHASFIHLFILFPYSFTLLLLITQILFGMKTAAKLVKKLLVFY
jgi:hypothetical protein